MKLKDLTRTPKPESCKDWQVGPEKELQQIKEWQNIIRQLKEVDRNTKKLEGLITQYEQIATEYWELELSPDRPRHEPADQIMRNPEGFFHAFDKTSRHGEEQKVRMEKLEGLQQAIDAEIEALNTVIPIQRTIRKKTRKITG